MALGSNIEYKASALFYATADEKSAQKVESRFLELSRNASEMSKQEFAKAFRGLGEEINKSLTKIGAPKIDINKILNVNSNIEAFSALGAEFGESFNNALEATLSKNGNVNKLLEMKRRELAGNNLYARERRAVAAQYLYTGENVSRNTPTLQAKDFSGQNTENISQYMDSLYATIENTLGQLQQINANADPKAFRSQMLTLENNIATYMEGIMGLQGISELSGNSKYSVSALQGLTSKYGLNGPHWSKRRAGYLDSIEKDKGSPEYNSMVSVLDSIRQLSTQAQFATKSIQDVNGALSNMSSLGKPAQKRIIKDTEQALDDAKNGKGSQQVGRAYNQYFDAMESGADWVTLNSKALRFLTAFNAMDPVKQAGADRDWKEMANLLNPMADQIRASLEMFVAAAKNQLGYSTGTGTGTGSGGGGTGSGTGSGGGGGAAAEANETADAAEREKLSQEESTKTLQQKIAFLKEIAAAYTQQFAAQDKVDNAEGDKAIFAAEQKYEAAKEAVGNFENQYHSAMVTMQDGSKINIPLDDEFAETTQNILANAKQIQNIDLVPKSAESAMQAYQRIEMIQNNVRSALNRSWGKAVDGNGTDAFAYLARTRADLETSIANMNQGDPSGQWDLTNAKQTATQLLATIESLQPKFAMILQMETKLKELKITPDASHFYDVIEGIKNGTFTTVDQCIAKFKELSGIKDAVMTGAGTGTGASAATQPQGGVVTGGIGQPTTPASTTPDGTISAEATDLEAVKAKVLEVTDAINTKTQAFFNEQQAVKRVAQSEVHALGRVEKKVTAVRVALGNLQTKQHKIDLSVAGGQDISNIVSTEMDALTKLRAALQLTTKRVDAKTQSFEAEKTTVNKVVSSEINALNRLNTQVDAVNTTVMNLLTNLQNVQTSGQGVMVPASSSGSQASQTSQNNIGTQRQGSGGGNSTSPQLLNARIDTQFSSLSLMYAQLESVGKLTPQIEQQWLQLWDSLNTVQDTSSLQLWREQLNQVRNSMKEIMIANNLVEQEGVQSFQQLIAATQLYNKMLINAAKAKTPEEKAVYEQEANAALVEQQRILQGITLTKEQQDKFDALEIERARQINLIRAQQTGRQKQVHDAQVETEVVKQLIVLYEQLGRSQFLGNTQETSNIRGLIGAERAKLNSVDYATDMKFNAAKDRGYNAEKTKAENAALKEQETIINELRKLYEQLGVLKERAGATSGTNMAAQLNSEIATTEAAIQTRIGSLSGGVTPTLQQDFNAAYDKGKAIESRRQYEALAKSMDADELARVKELGREYEKLAKLQAQADLAEGGHTKQYLQELVAKQQELIKTKQQGLNIDPAFYNTQYMKAYEKELDRLNLKIREQQDAKDKKTFQQYIQESIREAGVSKSDNVASRATETLVAAKQIQGITPEQQARLSDYQSRIEALKNTIATFPKNGLASEAQKNQLIAQRLEVDAYTKKIQELIANYERLSGENATVLGTSTLGLGASAEAYKDELTKTIMAQTQGRAQIKAYDAETRTLTYTLKTGRGELTSYAASVRQTDGALVSVRGTTTKTMGVFESIGKKIKEYSYYFTGSMMIYRVIAWVREGITAVTDIDKALTELKKVTDETEESYGRFLDTASKTSAKIGTTIADFTRATATFAKLGYSMNLAKEMAEAATVYQNVGDGIENADAAAESIISTMKGFNLEASESMRIVDRFNEVGNNFSITSKGIGDALQRSASALSAAGNSLDESIGLVTAANEVVQDPESVGTALKTLSLRLRGAKTELEEAGLETENMVETTATLQKKLLGLTGGKVDIMLDANTFKNTTQILREMSGAWEEMTDVQQAAALELMGGKRQANILSSIIQNFDTVESVIEASANSSNSALEENAKWMDSIEGKTKQFTNALNTMWNNTLKSNRLKWFVDLGTNLIQIADGVDILGAKIGSMWTTVALIIALIIKWTNKMTWGEFFASIGASIAGVNTRLGGWAVRLGLVSSAAIATNASLKNLTVGQLRHAMATAGVDRANRNAMVSQMGLTGATNHQIIAQGKLTAETLREAVAKGILNSEQAALLAGRFGLTLATVKLTSANAAQILTEAGVTREQKKRIIAALGLTMQTKELTQEEFINILATNGVGDADERAAIAALFFGEANKKLTFSFKSLGKSIKNFITNNGVVLTLAAIVGVIYGAIKIIDVFVETMEEANENFEEIQSELEATESDLNDLNSQLEKVNEQIEEIMSQGTLQFTDQAELSRLKEQSAELQRQIDLTETLKAQQQKEANDSAIYTADKYRTVGIDSGKTTEEQAGTMAKWGSGIGAGGGAIAGAAIGTSIAPGIGTAIGAIIGAIIGAVGGGLVGGGAGYLIGAGEEKVKESLANMKAQYEKFQSDLDKAREAYSQNATDENKEKFKEAQAAFDDYNATMAESLSQLNEYYSTIDLSVYDPIKDAEKIEELRRERDAFYDEQDTWAIQSGGKNAKNNAISRIFGEDASDEVKELKEDIEDAMASAKKSGRDPIFDFMSEIENIDGLKQRLYNMGLTVTDVKYYFLDLAKAEKEAEDSYKTYDTVKEINSLSAGVKNLKEAFSEIQETGYVSTETLVELEETFGTLGDSWNNFVDVVAAGTGSIREATEAINELLEDYIAAQLGSGPMGAEEKLKTIMLLQQLGVKNAQKYVDAMEKANTVSIIASNIVSDENKKKELQDKINAEDTTEEERKEAQEQLDELNEKTREDYIKDVEDTYQVDLTPEEEQALLDKAIAVEEARQKAEEAAKQQTARSAALLEKDYANEIAVNAQNILDDLSDGVIDELDHEGDTKYGVTTVWNGWQYRGVTYTSFDELKKAAQDEIDYARGFKVPAEVDVEGAEAALETAEKALDDAYNDVGLSIDIKLVTPSDLVDQVQSVFDTLSDAVKEFNEKGYLSVDTVQGLLSDDLGSKYLTLLQDENGQLQLNKESLIELAKARMMDLGVQKATNLIQSIENALIDGHIDRVSQLTEVNYGLTNSTWDLVDSESARVAVLMQEKGMTDDQIASFLNQISAIKQLTNSAVNDMGDAISSSGNGATESALEALQKRYERQINNLDAQQTQIENQIKWLETDERGVNADYYEKEIELENQKIELYKQEREELLKLNRTDEVADALWEVEHAIQESTIRLLEFREAIAKLYSTASDKISESYDNLGQVYDDRKSYIENEISIRETKGELTPTSVYDDLIEQEKLARDNAQAELNAQEELYWQGINEGDFEADSQQAVEFLEKIRQKKLDIQESDQAIADYMEQQKEAYIAYFDAMMEAYGNRNDLMQSQVDFGEAYIDRLEILNINIPDEAYEELTKIQEIANQGLQEQFDFASAELDNMESQGIDKNDSRYIEKFQEVLELEQQVYEGETKVLEYHQKIIENHLDRFNQVVDRINHATDQLENVSGLVQDEDVAEEDGSWTAAGLAQLGVAYQQMEYNKQIAAEYADEMKYLDEQFKAGKISEKEYTEQMKELENGQWDAINAYKDAEDVIVDLNETRIDMIEEGLDKEIEAYQELIDLKQEELDAERDLYNFRKDIQKQTKDIAALERRIASMSGSTDASTIAERKKLEAELREAREGLDDTYYDHAMDSQSQALDDEIEAYEKSANDYIESLRESIKDTKLVVEQTFSEVLMNADIVLSEINRLSEEYGFTIDKHLIAPWENASNAAQLFKKNADISSLTNEEGVITLFGKNADLATAFKTGSMAAFNFQNDVGWHMNKTKKTVEKYTSGNMSDYLGNMLKAPWDDAANNEDSGPLAFSNKTKSLMDGIVDYAKTNYMEQLKKNLNYPWDAEVGANGYVSWGQGVTNMLQGKIDEAKAAGEKIAEHLNVQTSSYAGNGTGNGGGNGGGGDNVVNPNIANLQKFLNYWFGANLQEDGIYGSATKAALKVAQNKLSAGLGLSKTYPIYSGDIGKYNERTRSAFEDFVNDQAGNFRKNANGSSMNGQYYQQMINTKKWLPTTYFAKGTLGTTRDQFAITDESWIGEEITLAAGKNGQLQYLKKGSAVMPADISANLVEWGKLDPNMMNIGGGANINMISNAVTKPELNFAFDSLVHVDNCSQDTLKDLEKMVDTKINQFSKQLNYSIKRFK